MIEKYCVAGAGALAAVLLAGSSMAEDAVVVSDGSPPATSAESRTPERGMHNSISVMGSLGYAYSAGSGFGLTGRYQYTVLKEGFLRSARLPDDFGIEGAFDYTHYSWDLLGYGWTYNEFGISATAIWNLWFTKHFAAYPRLGIGYAFGSWSGDVGNPDGYGGVYLVAGAGVLYELEAVTLRAEVSNNALNFGVAFSL